MALTDYVLGNQPPRSMPKYASGTSQVLSSLDQVTNSNSPLMRDAYRQGMETAATRGGINSSIAAGAAQRAALSAATPIVQQATSIDSNAQNTAYNDWLAQQGFNRSVQSNIYNANLSAQQQVLAASLANPDLYTSDVVSGYTNFFNQNLQDSLKSYFNFSGGNK